MSAIYPLIRILAVYLLFVSLLLGMLQDSPLKGYVQLFAGLFFILLAVRSFSGFLGNIDIENIFSEIKNTDDFSKELSDAGELGEDVLKQQVKKETEKKIREICKTQGYKLKESDITLKKNYQIKAIRITVKEKNKETKSGSVEELKKAIADCFLIGQEKISVS